MRLLLDTHAALWWLSDPEKLTAEARQAIASIENEVYLSSASLWEIHLKAGKGKLNVPPSLIEAFSEQEIDELKITWKHTERTRSLPPIHLDPFDRLLIAQALEEGLTLITRDGLIQQYKVPIIKA
ncbi:MAG: PIN domain nuclease of toxin-antitoxin system [Crocinitomicaceae bacterium]|jgi:PIN domain nuclease of toxin-antitoxin system